MMHRFKKVPEAEMKNTSLRKVRSTCESIEEHTSPSLSSSRRMVTNTSHHRGPVRSILPIPVTSWLPVIGPSWQVLEMKDCWSPSVLDCYPATHQARRYGQVLSRFL